MPINLRGEKSLPCDVRQVDSSPYLDLNPNGYYVCPQTMRRISFKEKKLRQRNEKGSIPKVYCPFHLKSCVVLSLCLSFAGKPLDHSDNSKNDQENTKQCSEEISACRHTNQYDDAQNNHNN